MTDLKLVPDAVSHDDLKIAVLISGARLEFESAD